ncbi:hypothetical protein OHB41_33955 [Streptomyces sp. NBC_01571]|uniref:hypothetical protein n=1 Tax=Streptomyces sp. NBC_01571 TaxID=2975883 RepID=UPI00224C83C2|nr:hypothetical protein [Streptomyces sp. NBC_01571]MCX4578107.1 hypothetical protein [Streptomyces sp. NBC_01571]
MTLWQPGMRITSNRLNDGPPVISTNSGLLAGSGFTVNDFRGYRTGRSFVLDLYLLRTGAAIVLTSGNLPDTTCATVPVGWRPTNGTINGAWDDGTSFGGFVLGTDGLATLRTSNLDIANGRNLRLHAEFIIDN